MSQELIKKCYRHVTEIVDKKFFKLNNEKLRLKLLEEKLIIKTKKGYRFSRKAEKLVPHKMYYYNHVIGTLHEYFFAKGISSNIENIKDYQESINKAFLKYNYAPKEIKEQLNIKLEKIQSQGISLKETKKISKVYLNGKGSSNKKIPSQSDVIIEYHNGKSQGISLKSHSKNKSAGLANSSPRVLLNEYCDLSYIKEFEQEFLDSHNLKNKTVAHSYYKSNKDFYKECDNYSKIIFSKILKQIKSTLMKEDMHHMLLSIIKLEKEAKGIQVSQNNALYFDKIYNKIISLKKNIKINTSTSIIIDEALQLRLKYSNGNMVSSIKLQVDLLK